MLCQINNLQILYNIYITYQTIMAGYMQQLSPIIAALTKKTEFTKGVKKNKFCEICVATAVHTNY